MIVRFLTGPGIPGTIRPIAIHQTWDEAVEAVAVLGGFAIAINGKRQDEIVEEVGRCVCGDPAQYNSWVCMQCERAAIDRHKPEWAVRGR